MVEDKKSNPQSPHLFLQGIGIYIVFLFPSSISPAGPNGDNSITQFQDTSTAVVTSTANGGGVRPCFRIWWGEKQSYD